MRKVVDWLKGEVAKERALEGEIATTYTENDERDAPSGHMPLPGTYSRRLSGLADQGPSRRFNQCLYGELELARASG